MERKVTAIIQARTTSERLPKKVLANLEGKKVIEHVFLAIQNALLVDEIILATTTNKEDDILVEIANEYNIKSVRGDEFDVLSRFVKIANECDSDILIRFTADDPLLDPGVIDSVVGTFLKGGYDYVSNIIDRSWPRGLDTEVFSKEALLRSSELSTNSDYKEHVTLFIRTNQQDFNQKNVRAMKQEQMPDARLCIDTEEDYTLLKAIFAALYIEDKVIRINEVIQFLNANPILLELNKEIEQKPVFGKIF